MNAERVMASIFCGLIVTRMSNMRSSMSVHRLLSLTVVAVALVSGLGFAQMPDPYQHIDSDAEAQGLFSEVTSQLKSMYGLTVSTPVELKLVAPAEMDRLLGNNPYKGAEIGLYTMSGGHHVIYVMQGWSRDLCGGVMAHEFTHAWQQENCPPDQDRMIKEGFAVWISYKYLQHIGAYALALRETRRADPIYGVGIQTMLAWEDKVGDKGMVLLVKSVHTAGDGPK